MVVAGGAYIGGVSQTIKIVPTLPYERLMRKFECRQQLCRFLVQEDYQQLSKFYICFGVEG